MSAKTKVVLGLVGAAAAGVIVGLLLAPDSGTNTRQLIKDKASDWSGHLSDLFSAAKDEAENLAQKGSKAASATARRAAEVKESYI